jgi:predicted metal-dependent hydrolase
MTAGRLPERMTIGELAFTVRESDRRRTVGITVDRDGSLLLHAPTGCDPDALARWAHSKRSWVFRKLAEKDLLLAPPQTKTFVTGEGFDYLGRRHRLLLTDDESDSSVRLKNGRLRMPRGVAEAAEGGSADPAAALIRWYRHRALAWLPPRVRPWSSRMELAPGGLDVRDLGYRWGSLGRGARLNIHWATMQLPATLVDYVIVHELAHIREAGHTPAFWRTVERALPDWESHKTRLAAAGATLWLG